MRDLPGAWRAGIAMGDGFAFIRLTDGSWRIGWGPFEAFADPVEEPCFYVNDWLLGDREPWKVAARTEEVGGLEEVFPDVGAGLEVRWGALPTEKFEAAFEAVSRWIRCGEARKMVPVVSEWGEISDHEAGLRLVARIGKAGAPLCPYGYVRAEGGFVGATPEVLFTRRGSELETMALAGTASTAGRAAFLEDAKEIGEHEMVVEHIVARLAEFGPVERSPRTRLDLEGLCHFHSRIRARISGDPPLRELIDHLHPTPAVGTLPATEELLGRLLEIRKELETPPWFGAPFGYAERDHFHCVVAIRGVGWEGRRAVVPSGCGIVSGSLADREWEELALKRNSVKKLFGL